MNKFFVLAVAGLLVLVGGCQKQQTEAERNAQIERQVNEKLAAEHQAQEQQRLAQRQDELDARLRALSEQEQRATATPEMQPAGGRTGETFEGRPAASYSVFYTKLEPLGVWRETSTYSYVWQPREAIESRSWRPYTNGHWVYTDAGWTWISEEPFGWATYHYGRWARLRGIGWVWVPGDEWAPAWVSWRTSNDYVGWAPLPPEARFERHTGIRNWADNYYDIGPEQYCFVPVREIGTEHIDRVVVPPQQNATIVNQTTNVTNITYNNTVVVNQGPNYDELKTRSQQPIARLRLERQTAVQTENPRPIVKGEVIELPAPVIAPARQVERPPSVKETVTDTVVERGWEGIADQQAAQQARAKIQSEATPPPNAPPKTFVKPAPIAGQPSAASPIQRASAPAVARSTITPAATPAASSPMQAPTAPRAARPRQTASPRIAASPRATPARHAVATATPMITRTPAPEVTATPSTPSGTARPRFSPRALPQQFSPAASATPAPPAPPAVGRAGTKEQRLAEKELRREEGAEPKDERFQAATPMPVATASPSTAAAPAGAPSRPPGKEHKKHKAPGGPETAPTTTPSASP